MRLDLLLAARGLAESRSRAQAMIAAGDVLVSGKKATKSGQDVPEDAEISVVSEFCPYVSRGGLKLEKAMREFAVNPTGFVCSDSGASTGGFTDCLLQHGAAKVYAIDVGTGQLAPKLLNDPRVVNMEKTNIRYLTPQTLPERLDLAVVDVSFISLHNVLPAVQALLKPTGQILCLIKPQFEAGREKLGKKGVVRDSAVHAEVLRNFLSLRTTLGMKLLHLTYSPVRGPEGNIEFLAHLAMDASDEPAFDVDALVRQAHDNL